MPCQATSSQVIHHITNPCNIQRSNLIGPSRHHMDQGGTNLDETTSCTHKMVTDWQDQLLEQRKGPMLVFCNVTNKIRKRTDTVVAFTPEYSRVSYPLGNVSTLSTGSGKSKDTHAGVGKIEERTFYIQNLYLEEEITSPLYFELKVSTSLYKPIAPK